MGSWMRVPHQSLTGLGVAMPMVIKRTLSSNRYICTLSKIVQLSQYISITFISTLKSIKISRVKAFKQPSANRAPPCATCSSGQSTASRPSSWEQPISETLDCKETLNVRAKRHDRQCASQCRSRRSQCGRPIGYPRSRQSSSPT